MAFRETRHAGGPPERWMQEIWAHQRLRRDALHTTDGTRLVVLHPGFWNRESGPDFIDAILQRGDESPRIGAVEIDVQPRGWKDHGHALNPAYRQVLLHVVWKAGAEVALPTLAMADFLDAPLDELSDWLGGPGELPREWLQGRCSAPLAALPPSRLAEVLEQAAWVRLQSKAYHLRARARSAGWHQALWEAVFRALGYKHNAWPMQRLAELIPASQDMPASPACHRETWESRLLGLSGLLPPEPSAGTYARRLWDLWWRERSALDHLSLPRHIWRLHGVRPANHPQRRLALAATWLANPAWIDQIEAWFHRNPALPRAELDLATLLRPPCPEFWRRHYTLLGRPMDRDLPAIGRGRIADLAVNALLPWLWARADAGADDAARKRLKDLYLGWPAAEDNAVLRRVRDRLFGSRTLPLPNSAGRQQGLLQIVRDFCAHSNALCDRCRFPALVSALENPEAEDRAEPREPREDTHDV